MAAPEFVPVKPMDDVRTYESPPRRPDSWRADRPGDLDEGQPKGPRFGNPGPDQGYALTLVRRFEGKLHLEPDEDADDVNEGCVAIGLKRASLFGRAPVIHDLNAAYTLWGFLDPKPPADLVELRKKAFAGVRQPHHWLELRRLVDAVPEATLRRPLTEISPAAWQELIDVSALTVGEH
jgi:hypothetical protein